MNSSRPEAWASDARGLTSPPGSQPWPEAATIIVACLLGVLAACMAVLVLTDAPAPNPPQSVDGPNGVGARVQSFDWAEVTRVLNPDSMNV